MNDKKNLGPLTFGFDIGIASVGWAVLSPTAVVDMGVRAFDAAEDSDGKPNNQTRRAARVSRNRFDMRSWRLKKLARLFRDIGMLSQRELKHLFSAQHEKNTKQVGPWQLRAEGLSRPLTKQEWAQVIYHIVKHRGFKFFSKSEDPTLSNSDAEIDSAAKAAREGLRDGLEYTGRLLEKYPQFKTIGQVAYQLANAPQDRNGVYRDAEGQELGAKDCEEFQNSYRNKGKSYRHAFRRDDLKAELNTLFDMQHKFGNSYAELTLPDGNERLTEIAVSSETREIAPTFRAQVFALLELQHPPISIEHMDAMIGDCELESETRNGKGKAERRAAKHTFSNERATLLQTINNLRIKRNGKETLLTAQERKILIELSYTQAKLTFKQAREKLREVTGFPANWSEASFTKLSYRGKRKDDGSWINVISADGTKFTLGKYISDEKSRKEANKNLKQRLEAGTMTFAELRQNYNLAEDQAFEIQRKTEEIIPASLEDRHAILFDELDDKRTFIKILAAKGKSSSKLKAKAANALESMRVKPQSTLADLRVAIEKVEEYESGWQFEVSRKDIQAVRIQDEAATIIPIEYEDPQQAEDEILIELKGWHTFRRALESSHPEWWTELETAWRHADQKSDAAKCAALQLDTLAEILTKAQTDIDVAKGLAPLQLDAEKLRALQGIRFKQYRNLSLKALRNILPFLEMGKSCKEACELAGYKPVTPPLRTRYLPPLETYQYERIRHGRTKGFRKTGHLEQRYKDLTNPVVARAFNQARLTLNALIARYDQSPAYVHVELARDIAKPKKGVWRSGKYIEGRLDIEIRQKENRAKREQIRSNFIETYKISSPSDFQILKERLYHEQQCKCLYTLEELNLDRVLKEDAYAQVDHIWPRSLTFDNSLENLALVKAHANQDKGNRIPYDYINNHSRFGISEAHRAEHWRRVATHVIACKGMSDNKQKRLLATELDANEFLARNIVDTRYATRMFARMIRDRLLFDGQTSDKTEDIDPAESGKSRLEKFHKTRVRTPQGSVTAFLRRRWLGDIKDREASDKHHAMDACIIAACTPELIQRVNSWFSNQEKVPSQFKKNADGTYTDKKFGEIISKATARERGLYLPAPWDELTPGKFRKEFLEKYESVFVSRAIKRKRNVKLHDANPMALKEAYRRVLLPLNELSLAKLDPKKLPSDFYSRNKRLVDALREALERHDDDGERAFTKPFFPPTQSGGIAKFPIKTVRLPEPVRKGNVSTTVRPPRFTEQSTHKSIDLVDLTIEKLSPQRLGDQYYRRNKLLIDALITRLREHDGNAKKAFSEPFRKPLNPQRAGSRKIQIEHGPIVRSIRLPKSTSLGLIVRDGLAELGESLCTNVHWVNQKYEFHSQHKASTANMYGFGLPPDPKSFLFAVTQNDLLEIILEDGTRHFGYFVMFEGDGRLQIREHDQQKQNAHRFGVNKIKQIKKYKIDVLGSYEETPCVVEHGAL